MKPRHSRREFLQTTAVGGVALAAARTTTAATDQPFPKEGVIDCQSHMYPEVVLDFMEKRIKPPLVFRRGDGSDQWQQDVGTQSERQHHGRRVHGRTDSVSYVAGEK